MRRIHRAAAPEASDSSSEEEDAFSALSKKKAKKKPSIEDGKSNEASETTTDATVTTCSKKRHFHVSSDRAAKMEALLKELEYDASSVAAENSYTSNNIMFNDGFVPHKKGSFVEAGEELSTTNIFVGNLDPEVTEEMLTDLFRQFGDLYSVKIMWPRTAEERARQRNTGFVCFMDRQDAADAMDAFQDTDCFHNGRRILLRWGKNVKKTVRRGTGGVPIAPIRGTRVYTASTSNSTLDNNSNSNFQEPSEPQQHKKSKVEQPSDDDTKKPPMVASSFNLPSVISSDVNTSLSKSQPIQHHPLSSQQFSPAAEMDSSHTSSCGEMQENSPEQSPWNTVRVVPPKNPRRFQFISIVASFVARDGAILEKKLIEKEAYSSPDFAFLLPFSGSDDDDLREEKIFYRWRVYAFAQNDGMASWSTKPFQMFFPDGQTWIPPPLMNQRAAEEETLQKCQREEELKRLHEQRRLVIQNKKDYLTGRQLEHAKLSTMYNNSSDPSVSTVISSIKSKQGEDELSEEGLEQFETLFLNKLTCSRKAIRDAMAFCFDNNNCAIQICNLLKSRLVASFTSVSIQTRIARLYLVSDVLFNSQQPGVRNAFRYRDAVEEMAPQLFESLGNEISDCSRLQFHKFHSIVINVLDAWSSWSVYNEKFMEDLKLVFEKSTKKSIGTREDASAANETDSPRNTSHLATPMAATELQTLSSSASVDGEPIEAEGVGVRSEADDIDGEPLEDDDVDGEPLEDNELIF